MAVLTLLTDFGLADTYVGQLKGAILAVAPGAALVDLSHAVPPQDVLAGAYLLWSSVEAFAAGAIHVAVVDPSVGSPRRAIALRTARGDAFVGPDNGLLLPAAERLGLLGAVELNVPRFWRDDNRSGTFDGRDIFGPVAGHLATGIAFEEIGRRIDDPVRIGWPAPAGLAGEVIHVDGYGNLVTNLPAAALPPRFIAHLDGLRIPGAAYYAAVAPGELLALVGSAGLLEISARDASAAAITGARRGTPVRLEAG